MKNANTGIHVHNSCSFEKPEIERKRERQDKERKRERQRQRDTDIVFRYTCMYRQYSLFSYIIINTCIGTNKF